MLKVAEGVENLISADGLGLDGGLTVRTTLDPIAEPTDPAFAAGGVLAQVVPRSTELEPGRARPERWMVTVDVGLLGKLDPEGQGDRELTAREVVLPAAHLVLALVQANPLEAGGVRLRSDYRAGRVLVEEMRDLLRERDLIGAIARCEIALHEQGAG